MSDIVNTYVGLQFLDCYGIQCSFNLCYWYFPAYNAWNILCSLRDKAQVEQLLRYVVEEVPDDAEKKRSFKYAIGH